MGSHPSRFGLMETNDGFEKLSDMFDRKKSVKAPAYPWQDLALRVIKELAVPDHKKGSVFKVCKEHPRAFIEISLADTKELCLTGAKWRYFFKLIESKGESSQ